MKTALPNIARILLVVFAIGPSFTFGTNENIHAEFETKYRAWREWITNNPYVSTVTENDAFRALVALGPQAVPLMVGRIQNNPDDFHLQAAVYQITRKRFGKADWPHDKLGDARTAAALYVRWWQTERHRTEHRLGELLNSLDEIEKNRDEEGSARVLQDMIDLGLPALPHLVEQIERNPRLCTAISRITGNDALANETSASIKIWWAKNRRAFELPAQ